jgi:putative ABC transport system permease protein
MAVLRWLFALWGNLFDKARQDEELDEEIRSYVELLRQEKLKEGMGEWEALRAALVEVGGVEQVKEQVREVRVGAAMRSFLRDIHYGARMLVRRPVFTVVVVLTLALGIGATTAIFSVVNAVLLRSLPYPEPERLVVLAEKTRAGRRMGVAYPNYLDLRERAQSFAEMAGFRNAERNLSGVEKPVRLEGREVSWNFFRMLGAQPQLGRLFVADDEKPGAARTVILGHAAWLEQFGGDPAVVGKGVTLNGNIYTVIGVMPAGFEFFRRDDLFVPLTASLQHGDEGRGNHSDLEVLARLKDGVSLRQAAAEMDTLAAQLERAYPATNSGEGVLTDGLLDRFASDVRRTLWVLFGAVGFVLLIACVNVANLLLVRGAERKKEIALRAALGAGRARLVRQLLSESLPLALLSGLTGLLLGVWMTEWLVRLAPDGVPRLNQARPDTTVLLFTSGVTLLTGLLFGLLPAWQSAHHDLQTTLKEGGRSTTGAARERVRKGLLVAEVGLSLVLLVGAGLMLRTFYGLTRVDPGFEPDNLLTMQLNLPGDSYDMARARRFYDECVARVGAVPGVRAAALTQSLPIDGSRWNSVFIVEGKPVPPRAELPSAAFTPVSAGFFQAMGIRLLKGRAFTEADADGKPTVTVVNETMARRFWPGEDPIGKRLKQGWPEDQTPWREVVGVVSDVKTNGVDQKTPLQAYLPLAQRPANSVALVVRASGNPLSLATAAERAVHEVDKDLPVSDVRSMDQLMSGAIARQRLTLALLLGFGLLALVLAAVGIYGVISYSVSLRTHEFGVRMALGACAGDVLRLVVGQGLRLTLAGVALGLLCAFGLTRWMESLLFGVRATDPLTFAAIPALLTCVALLACYLPARRAAKVDPMVALRYE